jgi:hypothetical protein
MTAIPSSALATSAAQMKVWEGEVAWMYLDDAHPANVTVGVGLMLPTLDAALALPFYAPNFTREATAREIAADYARVKGNAGGLPADRYRVEGLSIVLTDADVTGILVREIGAMAAELAVHLPQIGTWPEPAILAALDMAYNLGVAKLTGTFKGWMEAALAEDWFQCSMRCHRIGPSQARNEWTQERFSQAYALGVAA